MKTLAFASSFLILVSSLPAKPNVIYLMADELGYYEPAFMGGKNIQTPNLDRMAAEGMRFNNLLAGSSVCAPTRCCFLTGKHSGHTSVRSNGGGTPLRADEATIASILKPLGYATGGFGKWGNGGRDSTGVPEKHGFETFLGYYDQVHAHSYYPPYLIQNSEEVPLEGNQGATGKTYSHYVIHDAAMKFIREHAQQLAMLGGLGQLAETRGDAGCELVAQLPSGERKQHEHARAAASGGLDQRRGGVGIMGTGVEHEKALFIQIRRHFPR